MTWLFSSTARTEYKTKLERLGRFVTYISAPKIGSNNKDFKENLTQQNVISNSSPKENKFRIIVQFSNASCPPTSPLTPEVQSYRQGVHTIQRGSRLHGKTSHVPIHAVLADTGDSIKRP